MLNFHHSHSLTQLSLNLKIKIFIKVSEKIKVNLKIFLLKNLRCVENKNLKKSEEEEEERGKNWVVVVFSVNIDTQQLKLMFIYCFVSKQISCIGANINISTIGSFL